MAADTAPALAYGVDPARCYAGETVTFFIRLRLARAIAGPLLLRVYLPPELVPEPEECESPAGHGPARPAPACSLPGEKQTPLPAGGRLGGGRIGAPSPPQSPELTSMGTSPRLAWPLAGDALEPGQSYHYRVRARVKAGGGQDHLVKSWVELRSRPTGPPLGQSEVVAVQIMAKARLLTYLPGIYQAEENELLWRYLMLFDRILDRYEELLQTLPAYFDIQLAPPNFQPWLAAWVGLAWPRPARLVPHMAQLYQRRGTRPGLQGYLQRYLGLPAEEAARRIRIEEKLAGNFVLGDRTELGDGLFIGGPEAELGHFTVTLIWPAAAGPLPEAQLREIIRAWKPAHTTFELYVVEPKIKG